MAHFFKYWRGADPVPFAKNRQGFFPIPMCKRMGQNISFYYELNSWTAVPKPNSLSLKKIPVEDTQPAFFLDAERLGKQCHRFHQVNLFLFCFLQ